MGIFNKISSAYQVYKVFQAKKDPAKVKTGLELSDIDRQKADEIKSLNYQKKKIVKQLELEKEKIRGELEIRQMQAELESLQEELGDYDDDEEPQGSPKDELMSMFMQNVFQAMNKPKSDATTTQGFTPYPTGEPQEAEVKQVESSQTIPDEQLQAVLNQMPQEYATILKQLPESDLIRAKQLLNQQ